MKTFECYFTTGMAQFLLYERTTELIHPVNGKFLIVVFIENEFESHPANISISLN